MTRRAVGLLGRKTRIRSRLFDARAWALVLITAGGALPVCASSVQPPSPAMQARANQLAADGLLPKQRTASATRRVLAARVVAAVDDLATQPASRADIETLRQLVDALKDELDEANVHISALQERLDAADHRQRGADRFSVHGSFDADGQERAPARLPAPVGVPRNGVIQPIDPFTAAFLEAELGAGPLSGPLDGVHVKTQLVPAYTTSGMRIAVPLVFYDDPTSFLVAGGAHYRAAPALAIAAPSAGAVRALVMRLGVLAPLPSSLTGLAFRAPSGERYPDDAVVAPPFARGASVSGTLWGLSDVYLAVAHIEPMTLDTTSAFTQLAESFDQGYLTPLSAAYAGEPQRSMFFGRLVEHLISVPDAQIGLTFNRLFDDAPSVYGSASDTVFGLDAQLPVLTAMLRRIGPTFYAESAMSGSSPDIRVDTLAHGSAAVFGVKTASQHRLTLDVHVQNVSPNFEDGAPVRYAGGTPSLISHNTLAYLPQVYGFANTIANNRRFDAALHAAGRPSDTADDPKLSYVYPVFNPFEESTYDGGGSLYQAYMPNTRGITANLTAPFTVGHAAIHMRTSLQHLEQVVPDAGATASFQPPTPTQARLQYDAAAVDTSFVVPAFHKHITVDLRTGYDRLRRLDTSSLPYYPYDPNTQSYDSAAVSNASAITNGSSPVLTTPNDIDVHRYTYGASAAMPVTHNVKLGVGYSTQRLDGVYQSTATALSERKDAYTGSVTYTPHNSNASVSIVGRQYRYSDDNAPTYNYTETRGDVLFSVKF